MEDNNDEDITTININIEDILVDPSLEKEIEDIGSKSVERDIINPPSSLSDVSGYCDAATGLDEMDHFEEAEDKDSERDVVNPPKQPPKQPFEAFTPSITIKDLIKEPTVDVKQEMVRMIETTAADREARENPVDPPIINDPSEILDGTTNPNEIISQLIADPLKNDALYAVIRKEDSTNNMLVQIMKEIAEELSYLKAYRKIHYLANEDVSEVSVKRVKSLKLLVETLIEKEKLQNASFDGKIDFSGEKFEKVMEFILTTVKETFEKVGIPEQFNDIFFIQLAQNLEGFEKKVEKIYYGAPKKQ